MNEINWQSINLILCLAASLLFLYLTFHARQNRTVRGAVWFAMLSAACAWVLLFYSLEAAAGAAPALFSSFVILLTVVLFRPRRLDVMPLAYELIMQGIPDGMILVDSRNHVITVNQTLRLYLPSPAQNPVGQLLETAYPEFAALVAPLRTLITPQNVVRQIQDRTIQVKVSPVLDQQKQVRGRLFLVSDITAQAQAEQAVLDHYAFTELLHEFSNSLNSTLNSDEVLARIIEMVGQIVPNDRADLLLLEDDGHTVRLRQHTPHTPEITTLESLSFDYRTCASVVQAVNGPLIMSDIEAHSEWCRSVPAIPANARSYACVPIRAKGELLGFIRLFSSMSHAFTLDTADRLQVFVDQSTLALKNAQLYEQSHRQAEELRRRVDALTIVHWLYKEISVTFDVDNLIALALDAAMRLCRADGAYVALVQDDQLRVTQFYGDYTADTLGATVSEGAGIVGHVLLEQLPLISRNPDSVISALGGTRAQIALPLYTTGGDPDERDALVGIMVMESCREDRFTDDRFQLLVLLAGRVASALENARLVQAVRARADELELLYRRVSRLENLKSDMIRIAAHDLKNPLQVLLGYMADLLQEDPDETLGSFTRTFTAMQRAAERMKKIVEEILSLERIHRLAEQQTMQPFDLGQKVEEAAGEFADRAAEKGLAFDVRITPDEYTVNGDAVQVYEAITNFISNAVKYTPQGGKVSVTLTRHNGAARLEVHDTGCGIPDDQQARLFEPFFRAKTQETASIEGTGLGLHLVRNIVERHGGQVIFHSVYQQGSTFGFELPIS